MNRFKRWIACLLQLFLMKKLANVKTSIVLCLILLQGCAPTTSMSPIRIETVRPAPAGILEETKQVTRAKLDRAIEASRGSSNVRIVPLVTSAAQAPVTPEYRVFNVVPDGIGELLGLKNADILVAAHGYVIQSPMQFYKYLQLLRGQKETWIEVRREGKPLVLRVAIAEPS